jgi:putative transposase
MSCTHRVRSRNAREACASGDIWEHAIRDDADPTRHIDYIHFNPVEQGLVSRVCDWPYSSFKQYVARGDLPPDWAGGVRTLTGKYGE